MCVGFGRFCCHPVLARPELACPEPVEWVERVEGSILDLSITGNQLLTPARDCGAPKPRCHPGAGALSLPAAHLP